MVAVPQDCDNHDDDCNKEHKKNIFRRAATMADKRTSMEKFIEKFWKLNITNIEEANKDKKKLSIKEIDGIVHDMIH